MHVIRKGKWDLEFKIGGIDRSEGPQPGAAAARPDWLEKSPFSGSLEAQTGR